MEDLAQLEAAYEEAAVEFTTFNIEYNRALRDVDGDESRLSPEQRLVFIDMRASVDAAYANVIAAQAANGVS